MIWVALLLGLGGSLHCAAMCGPLVFSVQNSWGIRGVNGSLLMYHGGRILGYVLLGFAFSFIKTPLYLFNLQQYISLLSGILLLLFVFKNHVPGIRELMAYISKKLSVAMGKQYGKKAGLPFIGFLNGLLPCGLSYAAAAVSVAQPSLGEGLAFMVLFGAGTLPMFLASSFVGKRLQFNTLKRVQKYMNYSMVLVGLLLVLRGSGLDIPYLSPSMDVETSEMNCCHTE